MSWRIRKQYNLSKRIIEFGIWFMPNCRYKRELLQALMGLYRNVCKELDLPMMEQENENYQR